MGGVVFPVDGFVADHSPAGGLHHLHVEAVPGIEAERRRHDDRRRAGDRNETYLEILFLRRAGLRENFGRGLDGKELRNGGERRRGPDRFQESPAAGILRKYRAHDRRSDDALVARFVVWPRLAAQRQGRPVMFLH
jgi:hypothetical protein